MDLYPHLSFLEDKAAGIELAVYGIHVLCAEHVCVLSLSVIPRGIA